MSEINEKRDPITAGLDEKSSRRTAGCMIAVLAPAVLVVALFFAIGIFMLVMKLAGKTPGEHAFESAGAPGWYAIIVTLLFSTPILLVLGRALYGSIVFIKSGKRIPLVPWKILVPASLILAVPGLVFIILGLAGVIQVKITLLPWALVGVLILLAGPFVLRRMQQAKVKDKK